MRTFLSQLETARMSCVGEKARREIVSSGGFEIGTSFFRSPIVLLLAEDDAALPKSPDILPECGYGGRVMVRRSRLCIFARRVEESGR